MEAGPDGLFPKALKTLSPSIAPTLSRICKIAFQTSQIPDDWRSAIVTPVAKAPCTADPNLFRPISLTSVVYKVLEAILKEKMLAHLSQFSLLTSRQHGSLPRRSTLTNLLVAEELITKWLDEGSAVDMMYRDFSKSRLLYGMPACSPNLVADINHLERIQRLATRLVTGMRHLPYEERLQ